MKTNAGRPRYWLKWAAVLLMLPLLTACASVFQNNGSERSAAIDPPPADIERMMLQQAEEALAPAESTPLSGTPANTKPASPPGQNEEATAPEEMFTVYLLDKKGYLAPMTLRIGQEKSPASESLEARAKTVLEWLTADPQRSSQLPEGFAAPIPEGMIAEKVSVDPGSGAVSIDFAGPFPGMQAANERKLVEALVWSMTELPGIEKVKLSVDHEPIRTLPASNLPVDEVLTRGIGINIESPSGVHVSNSMAVTLYFSARAENGDGYFVPVTRLVNRTPDRMKAALEELTKGPVDTMSLQNIWMPGFTVEDLELLADMVNVSLRSKDWTPDQALPAAMMDSLVLTMTEAAGAPRVKVAVNGNDTFVDTEQRAYNRPVTRPVSVNVQER